jgi:hypothetical protein
LIEVCRVKTQKSFACGQQLLHRGNDHASFWQLSDTVHAEATQPEGNFGGQHQARKARFTKDGGNHGLAMFLA